jgi:DivIVA domain-containing protein
MDMNPQRVRTAEFKTVRKGLDPDEVQSFLASVADELERAQNQSTAMEARARAAVARLQELSEGAATQSEAAALAESAAVPAEAAEPQRVESMSASVDQAETISRTLLLAQRTADTTIADAKQQADKMLTDADDEAGRTLDSTRTMASNLLDEARSEARKVGEEERSSVEGEVNALVARRDFLESDVDHMEQFLVAQRSRLRDAANDLIELTERVPSGLGEVRAPLMSASDDDAGPGGGETSGNSGESDHDTPLEIELLVDVADDNDPADAQEEPAAEPRQDETSTGTSDREASESDVSNIWADGDEGSGSDPTPVARSRSGDDFKFLFDSDDKDDS